MLDRQVVATLPVTRPARCRGAAVGVLRLVDAFGRALTHTVRISASAGAWAHGFTSVGPNGRHFEQGVMDSAGVCLDAFVYLLSMQGLQWTCDVLHCSLQLCAA
jgi:hypothetical protein